MELISLGLYLVLTGAVVGFISGLLGIGGGIIMIPVLLWLLDMTAMEQSVSTHVVFGTSLAVGAVTALSGAITHNHHRKVDLRIVGYLAAGSIVGAQVGGALAHRIDWEMLRGGLGVMLVVVSYLMFRPVHSDEASIKPTLEIYQNRNGYGSRNRNGTRTMLTFVPAGFVVGTVSALFGLGGAVISTPVLVLLFAYPLHVAVGISATLMFFTATSGAVSYIIQGYGIPNLPPYSIGYVNVFIWGFMVSTSIIMARVGASVTHRIDAQKLRRIFAVFMLVVGLRMFAGFI